MKPAKEAAIDRLIWNAIMECEAARAKGHQLLKVEVCTCGLMHPVRVYKDETGNIYRRRVMCGIRFSKWDDSIVG